ncbi:hypothetical protein KCU67_g58, partial [Aureobasidium melanogenum]
MTAAAILWKQVSKPHGQATFENDVIPGPSPTLHHLGMRELKHGLAKPHLPVGSKAENGSSAIAPTFSTVGIANHGGKNPIDGNSPCAESHGHSDERRE